MGIKKIKSLYGDEFSPETMEFMTEYSISEIIFAKWRKVATKKYHCATVFLCVFFLVLFLFGDVLRVGFLLLPERWG
jgi:hypothetical protein